MSHVYCGKHWADLVEHDGWWWCGECGKNLWPTNKTYRLGTAHDRKRVPPPPPKPLVRVPPAIEIRS